MKHIKICGISLLLLVLLLSGCSVESMAEKGAGLLDKIFAGDSSEPKISLGIGTTSSSESQSDAEPAGEEPEIPQSPEETGPSDPTDVSTSTDNDPPAEEQTSSTPPEDITPSHTDVTLFGPGEGFRYLPEGADGVYACNYASEDESIASVDNDTGRVTAVGPGTTKVTMHVECNGQYDFECIVRCSWKEAEQEPSLPAGSGEPSLPSEPQDSTASADTITASHSDATFFNPKEHFKFLPVGAKDGCTCTYTTGNADIASVDQNGTVTAVGPGTTTVTMTVDAGGTEYIFKCIVRCSWTEE